MNDYRGSLSTQMIYPITPCPKPRMTRRDKWKKRPSVMRYRAFKDKCRLLRLNLPQPCRVIFWMPMPLNWSAKRREAMAGEPHEQRPDLDNMIKGLWDATVKQDEKLWNVQAEKRWTRDQLGAIEIIGLERKAA